MNDPPRWQSSAEHDQSAPPPPNQYSTLPQQAPYPQQPSFNSPNPQYRHNPQYPSPTNGWGPYGGPPGPATQDQPPLPHLLAPPPRRRRILVAVVVALALIAGAATIVVAGYRDSREVAEQARAAKATTAPPPASYSARANEIGFSYADSVGILTLNSHEWQGTTLIANVTVSLTEGAMGFSFGGWGSDGGYVIADETTAPAPRLDASYLDAGESATGNIALPLDKRGATTLVLDDSYHDPITALPIP